MSIKEDIAYLDLNEAFINPKLNDYALSSNVATIIRTLFSFPSSPVYSVQFSINGEIPDSIGFIPTVKPLSPLDLP